jgi:predicted HNH restriction endonuclease
VANLAKRKVKNKTAISLKNLPMRNSINKIQLLPMSEDGFEDGKRDLKSIQFDYLLRDLPITQNGRYYYETAGIATEDIIILFKFQTQIIGSGYLLGKDEDEKGKYLQFDSNSILIYVKPINIEEMKDVWPDFKEYGQSKKELDKTQWNKFVSRFSDRKISENSIEIEAANTFEEIAGLELKYQYASPRVKEIISKRFERGNISNDVKKLYEYKCKVCEALELNPYSFKKGENGDGDYYIEAHHIIYVSTLMQGTLDVSNLITVCANHHRQFHYGDIKILENTNDLLKITVDGKIVGIDKKIIGSV